MMTRAVSVGGLWVGGGHPIRIQSMTTTDTKDAEATVEQIVKLMDAGCEMVRVTVQGMREALECEKIKNTLVQKGYTIPLIADIHFYPPAAMQVVEFVDKVRINPGNFVDRRATFRSLTYDAASYAEELERIEEKFAPLVIKCKKLGRAMRIGANHGSLSDRILNYYGDSPRGMVESALEFASVARKYDYHDLFFSMKASNPVVMVHAYRLLAASMLELGWDYPLHLGVTEAGEGEDGRVKSAIGMGSLLLDGLGDTLRVSLTEDPWHEIDPCQRLIAMAQGSLRSQDGLFEEEGRDFEHLIRHPVVLPTGLPLHRDGSVLVSLKESVAKSSHLLEDLGYGKLSNTGQSVDAVCLEGTISEDTLKIVQSHPIPCFGSTLGSIPKVDLLPDKAMFAPQATLWAVSISPLTVEKDWETLKGLRLAAIFLRLEKDRIHRARRFFSWFRKQAWSVPVILHGVYEVSQEDLVIQAAAECGGLLSDGLGDGICLEGPYEISFLKNLGFSILQGARMRSVKTDFISCPSCGRTLFDLQTTSRIIRERTGHLPGVKIAIMGCIVNGPGEMADADFGYVGSKTGEVDLWVGKTCVERGIPQAQAPDRLVALIQSHGRWQDPPSKSL